jgi:DNA-binding SARP family transcriptional activator
MQDDQRGEVRVGILGPLEVTVGDRSSGFRSSRESTLLAVLAARAPGTVLAEQLIEDLWHGDPPRGAATTLRAYVSSLRGGLRALGAAEVIVTRPGGYGLSRAAVAGIDAREFERLVEEAGPLSESGERARLLGRALALWRGRPLPELGSVPDALPVVAHLEELRLLALERWGQARLENGEHEALSGELLLPCRENPLRERLWAVRMLALYRSSRQAEALMSYRELAYNLRRELGLTPSLAVRKLELAILRQDSALAAPGSPRSAERAFARRSDRFEPDPVASSRPQAERGERPDAAVLPERFVGRRREIDALRAAAILAREGSAQVVLITGEPGIGKSALAWEACQQLRGQGAVVLEGRCTSDREEPYQPWREALGRRISDPFGEDAQELSRSQRLQARRRLFAAVLELLGQAGADELTVLLLEDMHWASTSTLELLEHVARRIGKTRLLLILTAREHESGADRWRQSVTSLRGDPGFLDLTLDGLSGGEVVELIEAHPLPGDRAESATLGSTLHEATEGNPLFIRQMLAHMLVDPAAYRTAWGTLRDALPLPAGLRDVIATRLARIDEDTLAVLERAAIIGAEFDVDLLEDSLGGRDALPALERARRSRLLSEPSAGRGRLRFTHELIRRELIRRLGPAQRMRAHEQVARALQRRSREDPRGVATLAEHFAQAARPGHTAEAARHALQAARHAIDSLAFQEGAELAERGIAVLELDDSPDRVARGQLRQALAEARLLSGDLSGCRDAAAMAGEDARAGGRALELAQAAVIGSYVNTYGQPDARIVELCADALDALGDSEPDRAAEVLAGWADHVAFSEGDASKALLLSRRAMAAAHGGGMRARTRALFVHGEILACGADLTARTAGAQQLLELVRVAGDLRGECDALQLRALARLEGGDLDAFSADALQLADLAPRAGYWYPQMYTELWTGMRALLKGELEAAESSAGRLLAFTADEPNVLNLYAAQILTLRREQGRQAELRPLLAEAIRVNPGIATFRCASALFDAELDYGDRGTGALAELTADRCAALPTDGTRVTSLTLLAEVAARVRDVEAAAVLTEQLMPWTGMLVFAPKAAACLGAADRFLGMLAATLGQREQARERFEAAVALEARLGPSPLLARTRAEQAHAGI